MATRLASKSSSCNTTQQLEEAAGVAEQTAFETLGTATGKASVGTKWSTGKHERIAHDLRRLATALSLQCRCQAGSHLLPLVDR